MGDQVEMGVAAPVDEMMQEAGVKEEGNGTNGHMTDVAEGVAVEEAAPVVDREGVLNFLFLDVNFVLALPVGACFLVSGEGSFSGVLFSEMRNVHVRDGAESEWLWSASWLS